MFYQTFKGVYTPNLFQKFFVLFETKEKNIVNDKFFNLFFKFQSDAFTQRDAIEEASYLMNLAVKELADTKYYAVEFISVDQY